MTPTQYGTNSQKIHRQPSVWVSRPPTNGPAALPNPAMPYANPIAWLARTAGNALVSTAHRHREDQCSTDSLQRTEGDHQRGRRRHGTQRRCNAEQRDARQQGPSAAEDVADPPGRDHERAQRQHVDADHPLQIGGSAVEVRRHPGQRQVHREIVDLDAEQSRRYRRQDPAGPNGTTRRVHAPTIRPATSEAADPGICDASVTRETCVAIVPAYTLFLQVGLGVLCFVGRVRQPVPSLWLEVHWSG